VASLIGPSLTRLQDRNESPFFTKLEYSKEAAAQLKQEGSATSKAFLRLLLQLTEASTQDIIKQEKENLKKGDAIAPAALTGDMHGPDLVQSWLILNERN